ncbi:hypothetical protein AUJ14_05175 [Candidatus Micrarchaeota archaeon CG1_02_55_22]|nr:MAG: hypothetical protein AUJ14_05175 [Candidatus Micrarchaeota archaeon CG1_02_55_22]
MEFVSGSAACRIGKKLVISDLHLALEFELQEKGFLVNPDSARTARPIRALMRKARCSELWVLGDFKHDSRHYTHREQDVVKDFVNALGFPVTVVKGNHDSLLEKSNVTVIPAHGTIIKEKNVSYGLHHGHTWPAPELFAADWLLMGNNHPTVELRDDNRFRWIEKAWIIGELKVGKRDAEQRKLAKEHGVVDGQKALVFPAFSELYLGTSFNVAPQSRLLGPLFKNGLFDVDGSQAILLNGVRAGRITDLRLKPSRRSRHLN